MSENAKIKVGDYVRCGSLIFQVSNLYINHTGLKVCYFEGENPNECFVPHHMCEPVRLAWNTRPTDDRVQKLVEAANRLIKRSSDATDANYNQPMMLVYEQDLDALMAAHDTFTEAL